MSREARRVGADKKAVRREFKVGEMVLTRLPGLRSKLEHAWEGHFEIIAVPSDIHVVLSQTSGGGKHKGRRVHVNLCKHYSQQQAEILGLVV